MEQHWSGNASHGAAARQASGERMSKLWRILSIDGGGIRGLIPATILSVIEERTGKPIAQLFDIIAGTSTGGILALGLTKPDQCGHPEFAARALRDAYEKAAPHIFHNPASWWENLLRPKYVSSSGINQVMQRYFGDARLKDALTDILIPCYDIEHRSPHIFKSHWARRQQQYDFPMSDVACAAAATPTMFEPVRLARPGAGGHMSLVDGGVFANNPSLLALAELNRMFAAKDDDFLVVSLGTGESMEMMTRKYFSDWGYVRWSIPMIELVSESGSESVHEQMRYLLPATEYQRYYRFQVDLPDNVYYPLDNPSKRNMSGLVNAAEELLADRQTEKEINTLCKLLSSSQQQQQYVELLERINQQSRATIPVENNLALDMQACFQDDGLGREPAYKTNSSRPGKLNSCGESKYKLVKGTCQPATAESLSVYESACLSRIKDCKVVLCYAEEDLDVARPLADALATRGIKTVFEKFGTQPKESIRRLVSHAAERSLISIVVLSPALLKNTWASKPLEWLYSRTLGGKNVILPVMHKFGQKDVASLARHLRWHKMALKYWEYLLDPAEGTTAAGIAPLANHLAEEIKLWLAAGNQNTSNCDLQSEDIVTASSATNGEPAHNPNNVTLKESQAPPVQCAMTDEF